MNPYAEDEEAQIAALQSELEATKSALEVHRVYARRCDALAAKNARLYDLESQLEGTHRELRVCSKRCAELETALEGETSLTYDLIHQARAYNIRAIELSNERDGLAAQNAVLTKENAALHTIIDELNADNAAHKIPGESKEHQFYVKTGKVT